MGPLRILYVNGGLMHRNMDRNKVQIDFIVHGYEKGEYDDEIIDMGGRIFHVPIKSRYPLKYKRELRKIFKNNDYKIVHSHLDAMSAWVLKEAKKCGIPVRIAHSHNTQHLTTNKIKFAVNEYARKNINKFANYRCACSPDAAEWLFGTKNVIYVKNAIDLERFSFDENVRNSVRAELSIGDEFVIGNVGRFDYQKNHKFLVEVMSKVVKVKKNAKLLLVGDGILRADIEKQVDELGLKNNVIMLGVRDDVNRIFNAFDVFALPSRFEGLGIVLIEAQANGLSCIASEAVPKEANAGNNVKYLPFEAELWSKAIIGADIHRNADIKLLRDRGYDIKNEALKLQDMYLKLNEDV